MNNTTNNDNSKNKKRNMTAEDLKGFIRKMEGLLEMVVLTAGYFLVWRFFYRDVIGPHYRGYGRYLLMAVYVILVFIFFYMCDGFQYGHRKISEVIISQCISMFIVNVLTYFILCLIAVRMLNPLPMIALLVADAVLALLFTLLFTQIYHNVYVPKNMVMIYGNENALDLKFKMDTRPDKYRITRIVSSDAGEENIINEIQSHDAVIINDVTAEIRNDILKYCYAKGVRTYVVPKISDIIARGANQISLFDTPLLLVKGRGLSPAQKFAKRILDIILCIIALIPGLPIMAVVAICIKCDDHGPVFYKQRRVTEGNREFDILKFRSMIVDAEKEGHSIPATDNDPRITKVGKKIRAIRFDELPQIFNILKGDMSWVGPRPERVEHVRAYTDEIPEFPLREKVKGGLTGYAQIYGRYNTSAYDKLRLDLMYIENYSFFLDIKLILMTIQIMLKKESTEGFDKSEERDQMRQAMLANAVKK